MSGSSVFVVWVASSVQYNHSGTNETPALGKHKSVQT